MLNSRENRQTDENRENSEENENKFFLYGYRFL